MSRLVKKLSFVNSIAVIIDGLDEKWYIERVRSHYPCNRLREVRIEPNLPQHKQVKDLFELAKEKVEQNYGMVMLFIDFDSILESKDEMNRFKNFYSKWQDAKANPHKKSFYNWMSKLLIIINNPCLEYWYLLHFKKTNKFYDKFEPELRQELRKQKGMEQNEKKDEYYNKVPDIYQRLSKHGSLDNARDYAEDFSLEHCCERGTSEIFKMFDYFDHEI